MKGTSYMYVYRSVKCVSIKQTHLMCVHVCCVHVFACVYECMCVCTCACVCVCVQMEVAYTHYLGDSLQCEVQHSYGVVVRIGDIQEMATGVHTQPPGLRELRDLEGTVLETRVPSPCQRGTDLCSGVECLDLQPYCVGAQLLGNPTNTPNRAHLCVAVYTRNTVRTNIPTTVKNFPSPIYH